MRKIKTREQVREEFDRKGITIAKWARENEFSEPMVYQVLSGKKKGRRGSAHNIAIALGIKDGVLNIPETHGKAVKRQVAKKK